MRLTRNFVRAEMDKPQKRELQNTELKNIQLLFLIERHILIGFIKYGNDISTSKPLSRWGFGWNNLAVF